jgi:cbb3-type cytochrome oxidase subunit 3
MKLVDVMSASGLSMYAIVALVLFVAAFCAVLFMILAPGAAARHAQASRLPLEDDAPLAAGLRSSHEQ